MSKAKKNKKEKIDNVGTALVMLASTLFVIWLFFGPIIKDMATYYHGPMEAETQTVFWEKDVTER